MRGVPRVEMTIDRSGGSHYQRVVILKEKRRTASHHLIGPQKRNPIAIKMQNVRDSAPAHA